MNFIPVPERKKDRIVNDPERIAQIKGGSLSGSNLNVCLSNPSGKFSGSMV